MMDHGNPILSTANGEFVVKNLVLISAALVECRAGLPYRHRPRGAPATRAGDGGRRRPSTAQSGGRPPQR